MDKAKVGEVGMKTIHFYQMSIRVPMNDDETIEDIEDKLVEAVDSIGKNVVMSYRIVVEEDDDAVT